KTEEDANKKIEEFQEESQKDLDKLREEKAELEESLEKEKEKEKNFGKLRDSKKGKEEEIGVLTEKITKLEETLKEGIAGIKSDTSKTMVSDAVNVLAGDDKELKEKIQFHYDSFGGEPEDKEGLLRRVENAYILATGAKPETPLTGQILSSAGQGKVPEKTTTGEKGKLADPDAIDVGKKMGITDQAAEKHKLV
ncbi:unnamed protein product, partial [marine sediment metagenome]